MSKKITTEEFIRRSINKHDNRYDYSLVEYRTNKLVVLIVCKEHGVFEQAPHSHINGVGCKKCSDDSKKITTEEFIKKSKKIHGDRYDYSKCVYVNSSSKVNIICKEHGLFEQTPHNHLKPQGCSKCNGGVVDNVNEFIKKSKKIHGERYDYSKCVYVNSSSKVNIICKEHGLFKQKPNNHIGKGYGCSKCRNRISKLENKWLCSIGDDLLMQYRIDIFNVDAFDPKTNTIYEFYGDFWHGNPDKYNPEDINPVNFVKFGELYKKTIEREDKLKSLGYKIVSIWEDDYKKYIKNDRK
jgi:hypothetical protein